MWVACPTGIVSDQVELLAVEAIIALLCLMYLSYFLHFVVIGFPKFPEHVLGCLVVSFTYSCFCPPVAFLSTYYFVLSAKSVIQKLMIEMPFEVDFVSCSVFGQVFPCPLWIFNILSLTNLSMQTFCIWWINTN